MEETKGLGTAGGLFKYRNEARLRPLTASADCMGLQILAGDPSHLIVLNCDVRQRQRTCPAC
jgi:hypothetical protein